MKRHFIKDMLNLLMKAKIVWRHCLRWGRSKIDCHVEAGSSQFCRTHQSASFRTAGAEVTEEALCYLSPENGVTTLFLLPSNFAQSTLM